MKVNSAYMWPLLRSLCWNVDRWFVAGGGDVLQTRRFVGKIHIGDDVSWGKALLKQRIQGTGFQQAFLDQFVNLDVQHYKDGQREEHCQHCGTDGDCDVVKFKSNEEGHFGWSVR